MVKKVQIKLKQNGLGKFGYKIGRGERSRRQALGKAINREGALPVQRRLQVLVTFRKRKSNGTRRRLEKDFRWVQMQRLMGR